jgi:hypothetical protein
MRLWVRFQQSSYRNRGLPRLWEKAEKTMPRGKLVPAAVKSVVYDGYSRSLASWSLPQA